MWPCFPFWLGIGRFTEIGIPCPEIMAPFVGVVEIACSLLLLAGLLTRLTDGWRKSEKAGILTHMEERLCSDVR